MIAEKERESAKSTEEGMSRTEELNKIAAEDCGNDLNPEEEHICGIAATEITRLESVIQDMQIDIRNLGGEITNAWWRGFECGIKQ